PSMNSSFTHHHHNHQTWRRKSCLWPYWTTVDRSRGVGSIGHQTAQKESFIPSSGQQCTNKQGFVTIPGVENIDPFLLSLRFFGFDLWMDRYTETGKRYTKRNFVTKIMYYFALLMINALMVVHVLSTG